MTHQPSEGSLEDPAAGTTTNPRVSSLRLTTVTFNPQHTGRPAHQPSGEAAVGPDQGDGAEPLAQHRQQRAGPVAVLGR